MVRSMSSPVTIGIIGAGFSGVALAAALHHASQTPLHLMLIDKTGEFGAGDAYRTPFPFHLLNASVKDMSVYEHDAQHFARWLSATPEAQPYIDPAVPLIHQYMPRFLYREYLAAVLATIEQDTNSPITVTRHQAEVHDVMPVDEYYHLITGVDDIIVDKVVFCLGNAPVSRLPFPMAPSAACIQNPWEYRAMLDIPKNANVAIVGSGLSMIDAVLTLHHHDHIGKITVISRHGLLPLPHAKTGSLPALDWQASPASLRSLMRQIRDASLKISAQGGDWRALMNVMRHQLPELWQAASISCKQQFIRHVLPYWNIHRHRVHQSLHDLLQQLKGESRLEVVSGRVSGAERGKITVQTRFTQETRSYQADWIVNCMGSSLYWKPNLFPLLDKLMERGDAGLDELGLGLAVSSNYALLNQAGESSSACYALGPLVKGVAWETVAAPEIRKQCLRLVDDLLTQL